MLIDFELLAICQVKEIGTFVLHFWLYLKVCLSRQITLCLCEQMWGGWDHRQHKPFFVLGNFVAIPVLILAGKMAKKSRIVSRECMT